MNLSDSDGGVWQQRYKVEQILEVPCPKCGARPHAWCDRSGERLSRYGQELRKAGTPPSHQERMWARQGHEEHEFPGLRAGVKPGRWDERARGRPRRANGRAAREARRAACVPCERERAVREALGVALFPADFPCRHPARGRPG